MIRQEKETVNYLLCAASSVDRRLLLQELLLLLFFKSLIVRAASFCPEAEFALHNTSAPVRDAKCNAMDKMRCNLLLLQLI